MLGIEYGLTFFVQYDGRDARPRGCPFAAAAYTHLLVSEKTTLRSAKGSFTAHELN